MFFSINTWAVLAVLFMLFSSVLLILYRFSIQFQTKKISFFGAIAFFLVGLTAVVFSFSQSSYLSKPGEAIIFARSVSVKSKPQSSSKTLFIIHAGTKVQLLRRENNRVKVRLVNGSEGWISSSDIKEI
jgi:uncharacterized protein YgiM (DUF1202 family)